MQSIRESIALGLLRTDGGTQSRAELHHDTIEDYASAVRAGAIFPAVVVFYDGSAHWLADGFHRLEAYRRANRPAIEADIRQGTQRDAILFSVGANSGHGLRRTNEDKRRAVEMLLRDGEWARWSDSEIARRCAVGHAFVSNLRRSLSTVESEDRTYRTKHGTVTTMDTSGIGKRKSVTTRTKPSSIPRVAALDEKIVAVWRSDGGKSPNQTGQIVGVSGHRVNEALRRLGLKGLGEARDPLRRLVESASTAGFSWSAFLEEQGIWLEATKEQRDEAISALKEAASHARRLASRIERANESPEAAE